MNVLLDSAGDQNAKREQRVSIEESEGDIDEFLNAFFIFALVETIDDDEIRVREEGFGKGGPGRDDLERLVN